MRKVLVITVLLVLGIISLAMAAPVTLISTDGQNQANVRDGMLSAGNVPNGLVTLRGNGVLYAGSSRLYGLHSFTTEVGALIVGVYNTSAAEQALYGLGDFPIEDLEFEFEIGISNNNPPAYFLDGKGAKFNFGIKVLNNAASINVFTTAVFDY